MATHAHEIVDAAMTLRAEGLVTASLGNLSARDGDAVLITPTGLPYEAMEPGDLVRISPAGEVLAGEREPSSEWRMHTAVYAARPDAQAVVHAHGTHSIAWSFLGDPLDTGTEELDLYAGGPLRTTPVAPSGSAELADATVVALADRRAALMARHGLVAVGDTLAAAVNTALVVERQARVALLLRAVGH